MVKKNDRSFGARRRYHSDDSLDPAGGLPGKPKTRPDFSSTRRNVRAFPSPAHQSLTHWFGVPVLTPCNHRTKDAAASPMPDPLATELMEGAGRSRPLLEKLADQQHLNTVGRRSSQRHLYGKSRLGVAFWRRRSRSKIQGNVIAVDRQAAAGIPIDQRLRTTQRHPGAPAPPAEIHISYLDLDRLGGGRQNVQARGQSLLEQFRAHIQSHGCNAPKAVSATTGH
jgi:hypothetical protein